MAVPPAAGLISLENLTEELPHYPGTCTEGSATQANLYAIVDIGSNGIRFSISDLTHPRQLKCIFRQRAAISLFDALVPSSNPSGIAGQPSLCFPPAVVADVSRTLARFGSIADSYGVSRAQTLAFATEAMRRAQNAADMLEAITKASGLTVNVITPEVESLFGSMGARSAFSNVKGLFLDLGGGSVQVTYMDSSMADYETVSAEAGESLPFGAARLTKVLGQEQSIQAFETGKLRKGMNEVIARLREKFPGLDRTLKAAQEGSGLGVDIYMCGGGFRGYGQMLMHHDPIQPYPIPDIGCYTVKGGFFKQTEKMHRVNAEFEGKVFGMSKRRRQQFPAIVTVIDRLVETVFHINTVTFCSSGNREGALFMMLPREVREGESNSETDPADMGPSGPQAGIISLLENAVPPFAHTSPGVQQPRTVLSLGLGSIFSQNIWENMGLPDGMNASHALHTALKAPHAPGMTHLSRAILALTMSYRWSTTVPPIDERLFTNLQLLVDRWDDEAVFWAQYLGAVAAVVAKIFPCRPEGHEALDVVKNAVRFEARIEESKRKQIIHLTVSVNPSFTADLEDLEQLFQKVGKGRSKKVVVGINEVGAKLEG